MNFSSSFLCKPNTLDFVWIVLRIIQMYNNTSNQYIFQVHANKMTKKKDTACAYYGMPCRTLIREITYSYLVFSFVFMCFSWFTVQRHVLFILLSAPFSLCDVQGLYNCLKQTNPFIPQFLVVHLFYDVKTLCCDLHNVHGRSYAIT